MGKNKIAKHLIVISYDAFSEEDWDKAKELPNFSKLIKNGAYTKKLRSVYPTLTYVVHSTVVTGVYPNKHGIIHNNPFQPFINERDRVWYWLRKDVKVPTIYDLVKENNMSTAGIFWPVTGKSSIKYNMPEVVAVKNENQVLKVLKNGNPFFCINMERKFGRFRKGIKQPYLDNFTTLCVSDTIKRKKPNLLLAHFIELDDVKHKYGTKSKEVKKAIRNMDRRLGDIINAVKETGIKDDTIFIVFGDHGQFDVKYKVRLNNLLKEKGLIFEENGEMKWRAYFQSTGGSAYLYTKPEDKEAEKLAFDIINNALKNDLYGIEKIYTRKELEHFPVNKNIRYMVEAKIGYSFDDNLEIPIIVDLEKQGISYATHGYFPDKTNYKCGFLISGDRIKKDYELGNIEMVDIAPTMAKILGIDFRNCDGRALDEIFDIK
ncbi:alkaline phosphatase family protein [Defluviitalea phaphyphila]|uniref:alkaline phosphatase family protein n=1 Tax=Defluviitalea phaphyphila TaxID=1473580 RepID=UPI00072FAB4E|nr:ectonucleotide pyrophosphatase/phosphodiesterase [Defluviitalea phaphyphila]